MIEIHEQDADLRTIGHVCGPERAADLAILRGPLRILALPAPVLCVNPKIAARLNGICSRCLKRPVSTAPRKGPPRRYCDECTAIARETSAPRVWPKAEPIPEVREPVEICVSVTRVRELRKLRLRRGGRRR